MKTFNRWLDRFCATHPRFGIPNLMLYVAVGNVAIYLIDQFAYSGMPLASMLFFSREAILHGQIWRLVTFVFISESGDFLLQGSGIFFVAISAYFYWWIGSLLEREWGTAKFTVFYLSGVVLNIIFGMVTGFASMHYVNLSMFFAFATLYPDVEILLFMILPFKAKWLAWIDAALFAWGVVSNLLVASWAGALLPVVAILNYLAYFWQDFAYMFQKTKRRVAPQAINFRAAQKKAQERKGYLRKCSVCGVTDAEDPNMEFRYCSKCNGYYCYCIRHINDHVHVK